MQSSYDKDETPGGGTAACTNDAVTGEKVFTEPVDEHGYILLETRIAPDGTKRARKITRKGWPVYSLEERKTMESKYPPEAGT